MHLYQRLLFGLMAPPWLSPMRPMSSLGSTSVPASNPRVRLSIRHIQRRGAISHFINAAGWWPLSLSLPLSLTHTHRHSLPPSDLVSISHATVAATFSPFRDDDEGDGGEGGARKRQWVKKKSEKRRRRRPLENTRGLLPSHPSSPPLRRAEQSGQGGLGTTDTEPGSNCAGHNGQIIQMLIWTDSLSLSLSLILPPLPCPTCHAAPRCIKLSLAAV